MKSIALVVLAGLLLTVGACTMQDPAAVYDPAGQQRRAKAYITAFARQRVDLFDAKGQWVGDPSNKPWRSLELSAYVNPMLESGQPAAIKRANAIMENNDLHQLDLAYALVRHRKLLTDKAIARAEPIIRRKVEKDFQAFRWKSFQGDNDNFQLMAAATVALWGVYTDDEKLIEDARARLEEFKAILTRCGFASEFNSPAYLGLHLHPLAIIAETTTDQAMRDLAIDLETRTWLDLLSHYHPACGTQAGPWSREYNFDIYGASFTRLNLHLLLGDKLPGDWLEGYVSEKRESGLVRAANRASVRYHCPKWLVDWLLARRYPFEVIGSADGAPTFMRLEPDRNGALFHWNWKGTPEKDDELYTLPAWRSRLVTYMTEDYSLGTSQRMFTNAVQCNSFVATVPAARPLKSIRDTVRIHARYVLDEHQPAVTWQGNKPTWAGEPPVFYDAGRSICLQHEKTAMVLYRPNVIVDHKPTSLKAMIVIPNENFGAGGPRGEEIYIGDQLVKNHRGESAEPETVFLRIGETYLAFIPLVNHSEVGVELARKVAVRVGVEGKALGVSFYNHQGDPLELNPRQSALVGNGFVCEMGSAADDRDFAAFRRRLAKTTVIDRYRRTVHSRGAYSREVIYRRGGLELAAEYNPTTEGIRYQTINGRSPRTPQLEATDLPRNRAPFLNTDR